MFSFRLLLLLTIDKHQILVDGFVSIRTSCLLPIIQPFTVRVPGFFPLLFVALHVAGADQFEHGGLRIRDGGGHGQATVGSSKSLSGIFA